MTTKLTDALQLILTIFAVAVCIIAFTANSLCVFHTCYDAGWIIKTGEYILDHGIPEKDMFSWTNAGHQLIAYQWLFSLALGFLFRAGSLWLVGLAINFLVGLLVFFILPNNWISRGIPAFLPYILIALSMNPAWFNARPQLCSFFLLYAFIAILERYRTSQTSNAKWLIMLPPLMVLWANVHIFCFVGVILVGVYFACKAIKARNIDMPLLFSFIASALATLVNPYGAGLPMHFWTFVSASQYFNIAELQPWISIPQYFWNVLFVPTSIAIAYRGRNNIPAEGFLVMGIALLAALFMVRFEPVFVIASWPYLGTALASIDMFKQAAGSQAKNRARILEVVATLLIPLLAWTIQCPSQLNAWLALTDAEYGFLSGIFKNYLTADDRVFSPPVVGSWLIGMGKFPVFIDTRYDMYPRDFIQQTVACLNGSQGCLKSLSSWKVNQIFINDNMVLTLKLLQSPDWILVLDDGELSWWMKRNETAQKKIADWGLTDDKIKSAHLPPYIISKTVEFRCARYLEIARENRKLQKVDAAKDALDAGLKLIPQSPGLLKEKELCHF